MHRHSTGLGSSVARRLGVAREDVVAAAVRVCDRSGVAGLTVAAVAEEVGCRPPSVYHHVDGLDGLVRAVTLVAAEQLATALVAAGRDAGEGALAAIVTVAHDWGIRHPARYDALRRPLDAADDPDLVAARAAILLPVHDALSSLGIPTADRPQLVAAIVAAVRGCIAADLDAPADDDSLAAEARAAGHQLLIDLVLDHVESVRGRALAAEAPVGTGSIERTRATT